ncbi:tRNA pseudouridine(38-40) synthase TruA [Desulfocurvus sp. DL9XJH121]
MPRLKLTLAYDGTAFHGWQIQAATGERTVQDCLERALGRICGAEVRCHGSGRTDAGVHALGQVVHADVPDSRAGLDWRKSLNSLLPDDVSVLSAETAPGDFHARYSALSKSYTYSIWPERRYDIPQRRNYVWTTGPLDLEAVDEAARRMIGERDFACFQNVGTPVKSTVRTVTGIERVPGMSPGEQTLRFTADGFLKQMVRNMVGLLVEIGRGRFSPGDVAGIIQGRDRNVAFPTAPPQGLCLESVRYPEA